MTRRTVGDDCPQTCLDVGPLSPPARAASFIEFLLQTAPDAEIRLGGSEGDRYKFQVAASASAIIRAILQSPDFVPAAMRSSAGGALSISLQPVLAEESPPAPAAQQPAAAASESPLLLGALERLDSAIGALLGQLAPAVGATASAAPAGDSEPPVAAIDRAAAVDAIEADRLAAGPMHELANLLDIPFEDSTDGAMVPEDIRALPEADLDPTPTLAEQQAGPASAPSATRIEAERTEPDDRATPAATDPREEHAQAGVVWEGWHWSTAAQAEETGDELPTAAQSRDDDAPEVELPDVGGEQSEPAPFQNAATAAHAAESPTETLRDSAEEQEKRYRITLGDSCPVCRAVSRISFTADRPPQLPIAGCRDADGCRCELPAAMPRHADRDEASNSAPAASADGISSNGNGSMLRCPECGTANPAGTFYCGRCGEPILPEVMIPPDARRAPHSPRVPNGAGSRVLPATAEELEDMTKHGQIQIVAHPFANFGRLNQFITMLGALPGVRSVTLRRFRNGILRLAVDYNGSSPLSTHLRTWKDFPLEIVSESDDLIEIAVADENIEKQFEQELANAASRGAISHSAPES